MLGITRICIKSNWHDWRTDMAEVLSPAADNIYRTAFRKIGMELEEGTGSIAVTGEEAAARYDWKEGIDVILQSVSGARMTMQEKFLTYYEDTATFEERKTSGAPGAWYYCTAQYYFVGYARHYWDYKKRKIVEHPLIDFQSGVLLDFPALKRCDAAGMINWKYNENVYDGRHSSFRYVNFDDIPTSCIIWRGIGG
jgi:hypothetical protein